MSIFGAKGPPLGLPDGSGLIAACSEQGANISRIYQFSYPVGEARKITNDLNTYYDVSLTAESGSMVVVQDNRVRNIRIAPSGDSVRLKQLTVGSFRYEGQTGLQWTPDGKIVYGSWPSGDPNVWMMNGDGSNPRQLSQKGGRYPAVSPDGRYVVFVHSFLADATGPIWRVNIDGSNLKQLTDKGSFPNFSPDGRWVIYSNASPAEGGIWKVSIEGGEPVRLVDRESTVPAVSPDGKSIAYLYREQESSSFKIGIIPFEGGQPIKLLEATDFNTADISLAATRIAPQAPHWLPDGRSFAYIVTRDGVSNIWSMPIDGGAPNS